MGTQVSLALLLLLLSSLFVKFDASFVREHRKLANLDGKDGENPTQVPRVPNKDKSDPHHVDGTNNNNETPPPTNNDKIDPAQVKVNKESPDDSGNSINTSPPPPPPPLPNLNDSNSPQKENNEKASHNVAENDGGKAKVKDGGGKDNSGKNGGEKDNNAKTGGNGEDVSKLNEESKKTEGKNVTTSATDETCDKLEQCHAGDVVGCIFILEPSYVVVRLHNGGNDTIQVKVIELNLEGIAVDTKKTEELNISLTTSGRTQLSFDVGHGVCVLPMGAKVGGGDFIVRFPSYDKILTPVNGAYFLIMTVLVFGGTWACCNFMKKRHNEVPYQELEMAMPESASVPNMESVEGWDQGWDDDWDDDVEAKPPSPGPHHARNISANGLTSRSGNKDGWENNWDD